MATYNLKFSFLQKKTGKVTDKDVFNSKDEKIGKYSGEIKDGLFHGSGSLILSRYEKDDLSYNGNFAEGKFHGYGVLIDTRNADYDKYEGEFKNDKFHGNGILYKRSSTFDGKFQENIRIKGKLVYNDDPNFEIKEYHGDFGNGNWGSEREIGKPNRPGGSGKIIYSNGDVYEGGISDGDNENWFMRDHLDGGTCKMIYASGVTFEGAFVRDVKRSGKQQWPDGSYYKGKWDGEVKSGEGVMVYTDGSKYEGGWKNDKKDGAGAMIYADGSKYEGGWKEDKRHGLGTLLDKDGFIIHKGEWLDDDFVDDGNQNKISLD